MRSVGIEWQGRTVTVTPTVRILCECETRGMRLPRLLDSYAAGEPEMGMTCMLMSAVLGAAGVKVDEDEIYSHLIAGRGWEDAVVPVLMALAPEPDAGKPEAPAG